MVEPWVRSSDRMFSEGERNVDMTRGHRAGRKIRRRALEAMAFQRHGLACGWQPDHRKKRHIDMIGPDALAAGLTGVLFCLTNASS
ncbi:hypothetical protein V5F44_05150 [Xanthobacter sp. V2C-8]|uniref:hypothetical protein n=1 Tax=Xanthobacter albus TaxID=3119929 RepID=UPI00372BEB0F